MAAQEYFQGNIPGAPQQNQLTGPALPPKQQQHSQGLQPPYPLFDGPPPPYSAGFDQRPHSQPPPQQRYSQHPSQGYQPSGLNQQYRPSPPAQSNSYSYPPEKLYQQQQGDYRPQDYQQRPQQQYPLQGYPQQSYQQPQGYPFAVQQPQPDPNRKYSNLEYPSNLYRPDPRDNDRYDNRERDYDDRSRSRSRDRDYEHRSKKQHHQRKKGSGVDTFLGAGGGALIGDAIFPGLGTLGGALLGGFGGHEFGKSKAKTHNERGPRRRRYSDDYDDYKRGRKY